MSPDVDERLATLEARVAALEAQATERAAPADDWSRLGMEEGERRIVTVLFADVSGFTALSEQGDPETVHLFMRDVMTVLARCITDEGGTVEKFIGDAVCAIFGAPVAYPDEPERAARAALAMHRAMAERAAEHPDLPPISVHIGINTGPVIAGAVADGSQYGAMGDTTNTAARMMGIATDGQTVVTAETRRRLRRHFTFADRGLHDLKGKAVQVAAYTLVAERPAGVVVDAAPVPLVGRDDELSVLRARAALAAGGDGWTVVVVGEAGVGTTRLVDELTTELAGAGWQTLAAEARVHAETPLGLVVAALSPLIEGIATADLLGGVDPLGRDVEAELAEIVIAASRRRPLLVVLDDVDDADPASIDMVRFLSRATDDEAVLWVLVGGAIPAPFDPLGDGRGTDIDVLGVAPLPAEAVAGLIAAHIPGALDPAMLARLAQLTEGSPTFAVEIVAALVDEGIVVESGESWTAIGDPSGFDLPGSVVDLVEARIDLLATASRVLLQDAAVIGMRFTRELLARVATAPSSVDAALSELVGGGFVVPPPDGTQGAMWTFRSRLVRDVAYGAILRRRLPAAHRAVAQGLLVLEPDRIDENVDLLAYHFEAGDDPPLAIPHLVAAVDRAQRGSDIAGCLERCRRALRVSDRFPDRVDRHVVADLAHRSGVMRLALGDHAGLDDLRAAAGYAEDHGSRAVLVERAAWYTMLYGPRDAADPFLAEAEALAADLSGLASDVIRSGAALTTAVRTAATGDPDRATSAVNRSLEVAESVGDVFLAARARFVEGVADLWSGHPEAAAEALQAAKESARDHGFPPLADVAGRWLVEALATVDPQRAIAVAEPVIVRADDHGSPAIAAGVRAAVAPAWLGHDVDRARRTADEAVTIAARGFVTPDVVTATHVAEGLVWQTGAGSDPARVAAALDRATAAAAADHWLRRYWEARFGEFPDAKVRV